MTKALLAVLMASALLVPAVSGSETLLRQGNAAKGFESYLPPLTVNAPWLDLDRRTRLPKGDYPIGRDADSVRPLVLRAPHLQQAHLVGFALGGD